MCFRNGNDAGYIDQTKRRISGRLYPYELENRSLEGSMEIQAEETYLGIVTDGVIDLFLTGILEVKKGCF